MIEESSVGSFTPTDKKMQAVADRSGLFSNELGEREEMRVGNRSSFS
jgi:hypothetical protein